MKYISFLITVSILSLVSCTQEDFLDKKPYDKIITEDVIIDYPTFEAAAKGVYDIFQSTYYYNSFSTLLPDLMSDNVKNNNYYVFSDIDKYETKADNRYTERTWQKMSSLIAQSTIIIRQAKEFDFGSKQQEADQLVGQLYIARGLAYFDMQRFFAKPYNFTSDASHLGIPLINEDKVGIDIISPARSTSKDVYNKILDDFEKGINLINEDIQSPYYLNKYSAKALLARIYLYVENWSAANDLATEIINSGMYSLLSNTEYVSSWTLDDTSESIFSIVNSDTDNSGYSSLTYYYGRPRYLATNDLYSSFDDNDVRKELISNNYVLKYTSPDRDDNTPIIRLSEMYLIQAEVLSELGDDEGAKNALNIIHLRANPDAVPISESGDALKVLIQDERRKELMFEGQRLFDLTRKKMSFIKYSTSLGIPINIDYPNNLTILPIPQSEINANDNISEDQQNEGY